MNEVKLKGKKATGVVPVAKLKEKIVKEATYDISYFDSDAEVTIRKGASSFLFSLDIDGIPGCCGILELHDFRSDRANPSITNAEKVEGVRRLLKEVIANHTKARQCITLIFTLVDNAACDLIKEAVADGELFTLVKSFVNSNSGRRNDMYVSNN